MQQSVPERLISARALAHTLGDPKEYTNTVDGGKSAVEISYAKDDGCRRSAGSDSCWYTGEFWP